MNKSEKLAVAWSSFKAQLGAAKKILEERYRKPVLDWVKRFDDHKTEIGGALKVYNTPSSGTVESVGLDVERIENDLISNLHQFSAKDLSNLAAAGVIRISVGDEASLAKILVERGVARGYTIKVAAIAAGWSEELRDHLLNKGKYDGLTQLAGCRSNLLTLMAQTADEIQGVPAMTKVPKTRGVALQRTTKK